MSKHVRTAIATFLCTLLVIGLFAGCYFSSLFPVATPNFEELVDFVVQAEEGREFRILQLTDTQIIDPGQSRYPERIGDTTPLTDENLYYDCFYYIEEAVKQAQPDLIIMTGDNVYGEFDDNGTSLQKLVAFMEYLEIPWAPVWGNHDNESTKGVTWQCQQFDEAEHCLFKRGDTIGNSNYSIGVVQGNKLIKVLYMLDTNGCENGKSYSYMLSFGKYNQDEKIIAAATIGRNTMDWIDETSNNITAALGYTPSKFAAFHIPIDEFKMAVKSIGYSESDNFTISDPTGVNFGDKRDNIASINAPGFWALMKGHNFDGIFVGHEHCNNFSIVYQGVRLTFGTKSSTYDKNERDMLGGTLITVAEGGATFTVEHCLVDELTER